jgi:broad specificity phosphatase PhoE
MLPVMPSSSSCFRQPDCITENWDLLDPPLTEKGIEQCNLLQGHLQNQAITKKIEHIVTSPLRRTLKTTLLSLDWLIQQGVPVEVDAMWQGTVI